RPFRQGARKGRRPRRSRNDPCLRPRRPHARLGQARGAGGGMSVHPELIPAVSVEPARYPSLAGKPVLVTGGGSGIGASLVEHFAAQGCRVGFIDLDAGVAQATVGAVTEATDNAPEFAVADLRDIDALHAAI